MKQEKKGAVFFFSLPSPIVLGNEKHTKKLQLRRLLVKKNKYKIKIPRTYVR